MMSRASSFVCVLDERIYAQCPDSCLDSAAGFRDLDLGCIKEMIVWIRYDSKFDFRIRIEDKRPGDKYCKNDDSEIFI